MAIVKKILISSFLLAIPLIQTGVLQAAESAAELPEVAATIVLGGEYQICHDAAEELVLHRASYQLHCGIPVPTSNPDYKLMEWETLDPMQNLELVKTIYYWSVLGREAGAEAANKQAKNPMEIDPELFALYWPKAENQMLEFMRSDSFSLQHGSFDLDHDAINEDVYRMTPARRIGATPPQDQAILELDTQSYCINSGLPDADRDYVYYVPADQFREIEAFPKPVIDIGTGFLEWRGRIYWAASGNITEPNTVGSANGVVSFRKTPMCSIQTYNK